MKATASSLVAVTAAFLIAGGMPLGITTAPSALALPRCNEDNPGTELGRMCVSPGNAQLETWPTTSARPGMGRKLASGGNTPIGGQIARGATGGTGTAGGGLARP